MISWSSTVSGSWFHENLPVGKGVDVQGDVEKRLSIRAFGYKPGLMQQVGGEVRSTRP